MIASVAKKKSEMSAVDLSTARLQPVTQSAGDILPAQFEWVKEEELGECPYVHWARKPEAVIQPSAFVATVLLTSGPQGRKGQMLNRFCNSSGRKHPSRSC